MFQIFLTGQYTIESVFRLQNNHDTIDPSHRVNSTGFEVLESLLVGHEDDLQSGLDFPFAKSMPTGRYEGTTLQLDKMT